MKTMMLVLALLASVNSFAARKAPGAENLNNICFEENRSERDPELDGGSFFLQCRSKETKDLYIATIRGGASMYSRLSPESLAFVKVKKGHCKVTGLLITDTTEDSYTAKLDDVKYGMSIFELVLNDENSVLYQKNTKGIVTAQEKFDCSQYY